MSSPLLTLQQVNEKIRKALQRFRPELQHCAAILPGELSTLRAELLRARKSLENAIAEPGNEKALSQEVREYRVNLEKLKHVLPDLQMRLMAERTRLQNAQVHISAAAAWAGASKRTLRK